MNILYIHGPGTQPARDEIKTLWDVALFGSERPDTYLAYWDDLKSKYELSAREAALICIDPYRSEELKMWFAGFLIDMHNYFSDPSRQDIIGNRVKEELVRHKPKVVISHSLGAVIAYEVLLSHVFEIDTWITLGAPLGWDYVKNQLRQKHNEKILPAPGCVKNWYNVSDRRDLVTIDPHTFRDSFNDPKIRDVVVSNTTRETTYPAGPNDVYGYLSTLGVQDVVRGVVG